jgi:hypothetical protein
MERAIAPSQLLGLEPAVAGHETAERAGGLRIVRQHGRLLGRVEADQASGGPPTGKEVPHPGMPEHPVGEVLAQAGVVQPTLFLDRRPWHRLDEHLLASFTLETALSDVVLPYRLAIAGAGVGDM